MKLWILAVTLILNEVIGEYVQPTNSMSPYFDASSLKFVSVIARHGSRSAYESFPTDPFQPWNREYWPNGVAQLTKVGRQQGYAVGVKLRSRYNEFIDEFYDANQTVFHTNMVPRVILTAQMIATGMYPPTGYQIWNSSIAWQPIEVWPFDFDPSKVMDKCPEFSARAHKEENRVISEILGANEDFIREVRNLTGLPEEIMFHDFRLIYDTIFLNHENGFGYPVWADKKFIEKLTELTTRVWIARSLGSEAQIRLVSGPFINWIMEQLVNKSTGDSEVKFSLLSTHDKPIAGVLYGLGIREPIMPNPCAYLTVELHNNEQGYFVQVLYFNDSSIITPTLFDLPDCPHPCKLERFVRVGKGTVPVNWDEECFGKSSASIALSFSASLTTVTIPIIISLVMLLQTNLYG